MQNYRLQQIEAEYEEKKLDLQKKYADVDMAINIAKTVANGAVAAVKAVADLLGRPPVGSLVGALKRIVFRPLIVATSARDGHTGTCLFGCAAAKARPPPLRIVTVRGLLSGGSGSPARTGRSRSHRSRSSWAQCCRSAETPA